MEISSFKLHLIIVLSCCFWALQTQSVNADTPLYWSGWPDLSPIILLDQSINNWSSEPEIDQSVEKILHAQKKVFDELSDLHTSHIDYLIPTTSWQVYMMSAEGHGGSDGNDKKETGNNNRTKKTNKNVIICDKCQTPYYGINMTAGDLLSPFAAFSWGNSNDLTEDDGTSSACTFFSCLVFIINNMQPGGAIQLLESYPPCSFYAELDSQHSDRPASNNIFPLVYVAMRQWSSRPENSRRQNQAEPQPEAPQEAARDVTDLSLYEEIPAQTAAQGESEDSSPCSCEAGELENNRCINQ